MRILLVEDEKEINDVIAYGFRKEGFIVDCAFDGEDALDKAISSDYDTIILDLNLPKLDGICVCKEIRRQKILTPIIMLTARDKMIDKIDGLNCGADDYMIKPYDFRELSARVQAMIRRKYAVTTTKMILDGLELDFGQKKVVYNGSPIDLTKKEFDILHYLCSRKPDVCTLEDILEHCFDEFANPFTNTVRVHLGNLRKKLRTSIGKDIIVTRKGSGYSIEL